MNKYLTLSAAALFASTAAAAAATYTFSFGTSSGGTYCDGGILYIQNNTVKSASWVHTNDNCAGGTSQGYGFLAKVKGLGKVYPMSDNSFYKNYGIYSEQLIYVLPAKPKDNAPFELWIGLDGITTFQETSGVLKNVTKGAAHIPGTGTKSTVAAVRQMIATHGNPAK